MNNFWKEEIDPPSEYEMIEETIQNALEQEPAYFEAEDIGEGELEEINESSAFSLDEREAVVIYNANLRLEQANLYRMLINHNLFEGVDASAQAIKNVENELKLYITERLEILLGMKKERLQQEQIAVIESHFNDIEIAYLKQLAFMGTKGKSEDGTPVRTEVKPSGIKPLSGSVKSVLKPVAPKKEALKSPANPTRVQEEPLSTKPKANVPKKRTTRKKKIKLKTGLSAREMTDEEIKQKAIEDLQRDREILAGGNFSKLSAKEKAKKIAKANQSKIKRPEGAAPMPSQSQINMNFEARQQYRSMSNNKNDILLNNILAAVNDNKRKG